MGLEFQQQLDGMAKGFSKSRSEMLQAADIQKYPQNSEPALIHPMNSSIVKIRENGAIDIFVGTDNGIRINPNDKSIVLLSNTYGEKSVYHKEKISRDSTGDIGGNWTVKVGGNLNFEAGGSITFTAKKDIELHSTDGRVNLD